MHDIDDRPVDADAVAAGIWPPPYGPDDTLGTYNEVTPERRARAWGLLADRRALRSYNLGETLVDGFPAFGSRTFTRELWGSGLVATDRLTVDREKPLGANRLTSLEERVAFTFNMGAKINGLAHCGVGDVAYGGRSMAAIAAGGGQALDTTTFGPPLVTRGLLFDLLGWYLSTGRTDALSTTADGRPIVADNHRISVEDLLGCAADCRMGPIEPGDAVLIRTGWRRLIADEPERYLAANPGGYLRETRWLAQFRPALVGADTWCWETLDHAVSGRQVNPCHQELLVRFGIRLGESLNLDELADSGATTFVFCHAPLPAVGAISSNAPALALC